MGPAVADVVERAVEVVGHVELERQVGRADVERNAEQSALCALGREAQLLAHVLAPVHNGLVGYPQRGRTHHEAHERARVFLTEGVARKLAQVARNVQGPAEGLGLVVVPGDAGRHGVGADAAVFVARVNVR